MAKKCGVSLGTVNRVIAKILKAKLRKKHCVSLSEAHVLKRHAHSGSLYLRLNCGKWKNVVTTDEAMFYMGGSYGRRHVCYVHCNETDLQKLKFVKCEVFSPGFMVWASVSFYSKTQLLFTDKGVKMNIDYNINKVLMHFLVRDVTWLFLGWEGDMVSHQDSASNHTAKKTISFLNEHKVYYTCRMHAYESWCHLPPTPPPPPTMDFGIWGILKWRLQKHKIYTKTGLKKALKDEWNKLD